MQGQGIAFIGDPDSSLGFRALGVSVSNPSGAEEAARAFRNAVNGGAVVIIVTEAVLDHLRDEIEKTAARAIPAVIVLPGISGSAGRGGETIRRQITRAVGVDLMAEDRQPAEGSSR
jgi:V/A-type H+/Na+-transporting ATPase subunit F